MAKIVALLGDYWHNADDAKDGLEAAITRIANKSEIDIQYITHEEVSAALENQPDLFINAKMDPLNPTDEQVVTWLTEELDQKIVSYVETGGSVLAWHAGMADFGSETNYIKMLRGYFKYHPPGLQEVTYMLKQNEKSGANTFTLSDEQYFVHCDEANTEVDLWSTGVDGDSIAGWKHSYGKGKICCFTPAHTKEGMLNEHVSRLLAEKISWAISKSQPNQPIVTHIYTADPSAHVFEGKIYIYPSHDLDHDGPSTVNGDQYAMEDYHVLSMDDFSSPCVDHGEVLHLRNIPWAKKQLWAPDAAFKNDTYYLFFPAKDKEDIFRIGVATSSNPAGPFTPQENYIPGSFSIDPAVLVDEDNKAYIYFGGLWGGQLEKWQTGTFISDAQGPAETEPALGPIVAELNDDMLSFKETPQEISIVDEDGNPILAGDEDRRFFEGPWVHKYNGYYYLSYSTGTTHTIVYAMSDNPKGPYVYKGKILEPVVGWTTHHSIVEFEGKWYLFYHDSSLSGGVNHKRSVKYTELKYNEDGTIQTIDPYK